MKKKNFRSKLDLACSKDELRPTLNHIYFNNGNAVATDAHVLVISPLKYHYFDEEEVKNLEGFCIHREDFKNILKYESVRVLQKGVLTCLSKSGSITGIKLESMDYCGTYPNYMSVIPKDKEPVTEIGFDFKLIALVKDLIVSDSSKNCKISFSGKSKGVTITSTHFDYNEQLILVMPVRLYD